MRHPVDAHLYAGLLLVAGLFAYYSHPLDGATVLMLTAVLYYQSEIRATENKEESEHGE